MKLRYKQQGMTLVEVLIAGIILFISISAISMVARTKILNEARLARAIEYAYLAEFSQGTIKYHLKYTSEREGRLIIGNTEYQWNALIESARAAVVGLDDSEGVSTPSEVLLTLYKVVVTPLGSEKKVYEYTELLSTMP